MANLQSIWDYMPSRFVTFLSFAFNYHFYQLNVFGYHLFNLAIHLATAILVWWLTLLTFSTPVMKKDKISQHANLISLLAGLVFVSHPLQTESVTYICQRSASLAALFYLASLCFYIKSRDAINGVSTSFYYVASLITAILAMFTKETAITLPLMILLYEYCFLKTKKNLEWKTLTPFLLTLLIIPATMFLTKSKMIQAIQGITQGPGGISPMHYLLTEFRVMITYIRLMFLPLNQNLDYDYPISKSIFEMPTLLSFLFLITLLFWAKRLFSQYRFVSFSIFWFFLTLLPESSILPEIDVIFEHRLYLPLAGFSMFLAGGVYYVFSQRHSKAQGRRISKKLYLSPLLIIIACYSVLTYQRNNVWKDEFTLWDDAVRKSPHKPRPYNNRGFILFKQGNLTRSLSDFTKVIEIKPDYANAYYNLGLIYYNQGNLTQSLSDYNKAIEIDPSQAVPFYNRGLLYAKQGIYAQAILDFTKAIELKPDYEEAYNNRGNVYKIQGDLVHALSDYDKAIGINPDFAEAYNNRGLIYHPLNAAPYKK